jgi:hypothetical protein
MNFNSTSSLNFDEAVNAADKIMAKKNPKFRIISKLMISRKIRTYGYFCYYYLRWVDEYIDSNFNSLTEKKVFFENQKTLTYSIIKGENVKLNFTEEYFLLYFMNYALSQPTRLLVDSFTRLLGTIGDDIRRLENRGLFSENEKQSYMNENTKSLFNITNYFLVPESAFKYQTDFNCIRTLVYTFLIRDLEEDFNLGYINISDEEIRRYQLNVVDLLNDNNLVIWYKDNFSLLNKWLNEDILILKKFPLKLKLFWFWQFPYCVHKMNRIKFYNYNPTIETKKSAVKEIKLYTLTILSTFKFIYKIFLPLEFTSFNFN